MNSDYEMLRRLELTEGVMDIVIDTDTYNEVDDQFAIVYALQSPERFNVKAIYACPFYKPEYNNRSSSPEDGMEKSYREIIDLLQLMNINSDGFVFKGSRNFLTRDSEPESCEAVDNLINLVMNKYSRDNPLNIVAIGALTNIAVAIKREPLICERLNIIWLGGPIHSWNSATEFNLDQDIIASKVVFESDVALTQVPCFGVASHLLTNIYELENCLDLSVAINKRLFETYRSYTEDHFAYSKEIWDIAPFAFLMNPDKFSTSFIYRRPTITLDTTYSTRYDTQFMRVIQTLNRNAIFNNLFSKLNNVNIRRNNYKNTTPHIEATNKSL